MSLQTKFQVRIQSSRLLLTEDEPMLMRLLPSIKYDLDGNAIPVRRKWYANFKHKNKHKHAGVSLGAYEEQLKAFYKEQKLDNYDPLALNNAFFNTTSKFRNEKYQQHSAKVMEKIKGLTEKSFTNNISGTIIDGQDDAKTANEGSPSKPFVT